MNHLFRELAPISDAGWQEIEKEAKRTLKTTLCRAQAGRFRRTAGLAGIGRRHRAQQADAKPPARTSVETRLRQVLPLVELRVPFELRRAELDALDRGAKDFDTDPIIDAARDDRHRRGPGGLPWLSGRRHRGHLRGAAARVGRDQRRLRRLSGAGDDAR